MKVHCHTNLDLRSEKWPTDLPAVPRIGERIQSATKHGNFQLELEVVAVTWVKCTDWNGAEYWAPSVELHMTSFQRRLPCAARSEGCKCADGSVCAFYHWYAPLVGTTASAFI